MIGNSGRDPDDDTWVIDDPTFRIIIGNTGRNNDEEDALRVALDVCCYAIKRNIRSGSTMMLGL